MHIEPGFVAPIKVTMANAGAIAVILWGCKEQIKETIVKPWVPLKSLLAAAFFSFFMESYSISVGPSELHFIGAMVMYLILGFTPTLIGFGAGLLFQGLIFNPGDLYHLGVNSLTLIIPLLGVHYLSGHKYFSQSSQKRLSWRRILELDIIYYSGVTAMVGFWLVIGDVATPISAWATWASSYLAIVILEPIFTYLLVKLLKAMRNHALVSRLTVINTLYVT